MPTLTSAEPSAPVDPRAVRAARQQLRASILFGAEAVPLRAGAATTPVLTSEFVDRGPTSPSALAPAPSPKPVMATEPRPATPPAPIAVQAVAPVIVENKPRTLAAHQVEKQSALDALRTRYEKEAPHQHFVTDHHCIVWGDGDPAARLMIIGEAPGAEEDKVGIPFVGRAGQLLEKMLTAMGLHRSRVYITNVLKTRPPNNATPTADEAAACAPFLFEQIRIIGPECILALGLPATKVLLNTVDSMSRLRGRWWDYSDPRTTGFRVPVMPTYHPAFLLRSYTRENREKVWSDLQMVMQRLGGASTMAAV